MIIEIILAIETVAFIVEGYVIWNLFRKTELLETWVETFTRRIQHIQDNLKEIDSTGHFESDDEIGSIFSSIKEVIDELNDLTEGEEISE